MSQGDAPRRKKAIVKDVDPNRMPYEAAEALLWGRATYEQHGVLYHRMKDLEQHHEGYEARIQAAESITEAAKQVTSSIRRIEERVKAIEEDDQDQPVINWVTAELTPLKAFVHENKNLRQRQIELEKRLSDQTDHLDRVRHVPDELRTLVQRVADLLDQRSKDVEHIQRLERDFKSLSAERSLHGRRSPKKTFQRNSPLPPKLDRQADPVRSDPGEETVDENEDEVLFATCTVPSSEFARALQVAKPPGMSTSTIHGSPTRDKESMSARLRMMQRKSIHEPKIGRDLESTQIRDDRRSNLHSEGLPHHDPGEIPATQIVARAPPPTSQRNDVSSYQGIRVSPERQLIVKLPVSPSRAQPKATSNVQLRSAPERHEQKLSSSQRNIRNKLPQGHPKKQSRAAPIKEKSETPVKQQQVQPQHHEQEGSHRQSKNKIPQASPMKQSCASPVKRAIQSPTKQQRLPAQQPREFETHNTRVTRSQARAQVEVLSRYELTRHGAQPIVDSRIKATTRGSKAESGELVLSSPRNVVHQPAPAETQLVSEHAAKRRKLNMESSLSKPKARNVKKRGVDMISSDDEQRHQAYVPRKKPKADHSPEPVIRSIKEAAGKVRSPRKTLVSAISPRKTIKPTAAASKRPQNQQPSASLTQEINLDFLMDDSIEVESRAGKLRSPRKYGYRR